MNYELRTTPKFETLFRKLDKEAQVRVLKQISSLPEGPFQGKHLHGSLKGRLSLRVGEYRVIYRVEGNVILLLTVAHRKKIYER